MFSHIVRQWFTRSFLVAESSFFLKENKGEVSMCWISHSTDVHASVTHSTALPDRHGETTLHAGGRAGVSSRRHRWAQAKASWIRGLHRKVRWCPWCTHFSHFKGETAMQTVTRLRAHQCRGHMIQGNTALSLLFIPSCRHCSKSHCNWGQTLCSRGETDCFYTQTAWKKPPARTSGAAQTNSPLKIRVKELASHPNLQLQMPSRYVTFKTGDRGMIQRRTPKLNQAEELHSEKYFECGYQYTVLETNQKTTSFWGNYIIKGAVGV